MRDHRNSVRATSRGFWMHAFAGVSAVALMAVGQGAAFAQQTTPPPAPEAEASETEAVVVTGSYIRRAVSDTPTPVSVVGTDELEKQGILGADYLFKNLPMANGARSTPDNTNSPFQLGMGNINLRGLGVSSTLTLINGRRQVVSPVPLDDGSSFVDINVIPLVMLERLEILQDGGAALYGSDAVAGVANFVMREKFDGVRVTGSYQTTTEDNQQDINLGIVGGLSGDRWNLVVGVEGLHREPLGTQERPFSRNKIISSLGMPGAYGLAGTPRIDPNCTATGGTPVPFGAPGVGFCARNLSDAFTSGLIVPEDRVLGYATFNYELSNTAKLYAELGASHNDLAVHTFPSYSNLSFPTIPANNPGNLVANGGFGVPVTFFGRPLNLQNSTINEQRRRSDQYRFVGGLEGEFASGWTYDASYTFSTQHYSATNIRDTLSDRFIAALNGVGGPNNNQYFNPFGSSLTNPALANDPAVIADFTAEAWRDYKSYLHSLDAVVTGTAGDISGRPVHVALGAQARTESLEFKSDLNQQTGRFVFLFSGKDLEVDRTSYAGFGEVSLPIAKNAELLIQARYEWYDGGVGGSLNPKAALRWEPVEGLVFRANAGTSFRAPSLSQISSISTINTSIADPLNPSIIPFFNKVVTTPGAALEPETAVNLGGGVLWSPVKGLDFSLDYWRYDYSDLIVKQSAQAIVSANPNDPRVIRQGGLPNGLISEIRVTFVNQNQVLTDGFDFSGRYRTDFGPGDLDLTLRGTYMNQYTTVIGGREVDVSGKRNFSNFARSLPKLRSSAIAAYSWGPSTFTTTVNYISAYDDYRNQAAQTNEYELDAFMTIDLGYSLSLESIGTDFSIGVINLSNIYPPNSQISSGDLQGFDRFVHDPRGRLAYVRLAKQF